MVRLERIELENFKSYAEKTVVGPLRDFTAVIGPNGAGKSNLMDAISFVVGVKTRTLRGQQMRDLVYRSPSESESERVPRNCQVSLVFATTEGETLVFTRRLTPGGSSEYRIRDRVVTYETYRQELEELGITSRSRSNFLIFQNEVQSIANQSSKDFANMLELVSGSSEYREEYTKKKQEKDSAEENVVFMFKKKKGLSAEKKQYKQQKEEAEKYKSLNSNLEQTRSEEAVFKLYHVNKDIDKVQVELAKDFEEGEKLKEKTEDVEKQIDAGRKVLARIARDKTSKERKQQQALNEKQRERPDEVRIGTQLQHLRSRITSEEEALKKAQNEREKREQELQTLLSSEKDIREALALVENDLSAAETSSLSGSSVSEYRQLKDRTESLASVQRQEMAAIQRSVRLITQRRSALENQRDDCNGRITLTMNEIAALDAHLTEFQRRIRESEDEVNRFQTSMQTFQTEVQERTRQRQDLEHSIEEATNALREAKADSAEDARERRFDEALKSMKRMYPGVKGLLSDLCKPTQRRYQDAVALIFGNLMDAIVVDTAQTAEECIMYLKEQRSGRATFLPLSDLRPAPIDDSLRYVGGSARMVLDVLSFRDEVSLAVQYAAGSALVCDTLDEARRICFGPNPRRVKICSLDGSLITPAGFITGGTLEQDSGRGRRWDREETERWKRVREKSQRELQSLPSSGEERMREAESSQRVFEARRKLDLLRIESTNIQDRRMRADISVKEAQQALLTIESNLSAVAGDLENRISLLSRLESDLEAIEAGVFRDFLDRVGIDSVKNFEETVLQRVESLLERKMGLDHQLAKINSQLEYQRSRDVDSPVQSVQESLASLKNKMQALTDEEEKAKTLLQEREESLKELQVSLASLAEEAVAAGGEQEQRKSELASLSESFERVRKKLSVSESEMENLQSRRKEIIRHYRMEQVHVPYNQEYDDGRVEEAEFTPDEEGNIPEGLRLNVSSLNRKQREAKTSAARAEFELQFKEKVSAIQSELEKLAPNLRATDHVTDVEQRMEEVNLEFEQARELAGKTSKEFEDVRQKRHDLFIKCFNKVAAKINDIYKELTQSAAYPMGGTAYISLESQEEPYLSGVKYNAMPPTKRFRDMEQLSGGERTVAALALLFALHAFQPSPFLVLDEVDAALDNLNLGRVSGYLQSHASSLQTIVISLKEFMYEKADALVGIQRRVNANKSNVFTLELIDFDEPRQEESAGMTQAVTA